jgi:hypothetical protein
MPATRLGLRHLARVAVRNGISNRVGRGPILQKHADRPSLEALGNLLYLIRRSLDDPAKAKAYLDVANKVLADIAANQPPTHTRIRQGAVFITRDQKYCRMSVSVALCFTATLWQRVDHLHPVLFSCVWDVIVHLAWTTAPGSAESRIEFVPCGLYCWPPTHDDHAGGMTA